MATVYPRARHQRCWVHKMRNFRERCGGAMRTGQARRPKIYLGATRRGARSLSAISISLAGALSQHGESAGAGSARTVEVLRFPRPCGASCAPPMPSSAASSKFAGEPGPWSCSPMWKAWIESSMRFSVDSMKTGKTTPSNYLHKQLDVTVIFQLSHFSLLTV